MRSIIVLPTYLLTESDASVSELDTYIHTYIHKNL